MKERDLVDIYVQEHCDSMNTKQGKYEALLYAKGKELKLARSFTDSTTNYRIAIQAAIDAIGKLKRPCEINLYTTTPFGYNKLVYPDGSWREIPKNSVNKDLLLQLKEVIVSGSHILHYHTDKDIIDQMIGKAPQEYKTISIRLSDEEYDLLHQKCQKMGITVGYLAEFMMKRWIKE